MCNVMKKQGRLIVHTGSMFSGKTTSLWRELFRLKIAKYKVIAFKPQIDNRDADNKIVTHDRKSVEAIKIAKIESILDYIENNETDAVGIDEIQFFENTPKEVVETINHLIARNITVVVSGLDMDFKSQPFEIVKELMPIADVLEKHHAICATCGEDAWVSFKKTSDDNRITIGAEEIYEPLCRQCFKEKMQKKENEKLQYKIDENTKK